MRGVAATYLYGIIESIHEASIMPARFNLRPVLAIAGVAAVLSLAACENQYGPPPEGKPQNWGQQHYLDNQRYQQMNQDRMP